MSSSDRQKSENKILRNLLIEEILTNFLHPNLFRNLLTTPTIKYIYHSSYHFYLQTNLFTILLTTSTSKFIDKSTNYRSNDPRNPGKDAPSPCNGGAIIKHLEDLDENDNDNQIQ